MYVCAYDAYIYGIDWLPLISNVFLKDGEIPRLIEICSTSNETATTIWIILWLCYKGVLLLVGLFFAAAIQNVKIRALNDSNIIAGSVYCIAAISAVLTFIGFFLTEQIDYQYVIIGAFVILTVTVILCVIFVPMVSICCHICTHILFNAPRSRLCLMTHQGKLRQMSLQTFHQDNLATGIR